MKNFFKSFFIFFSGMMFSGFLLFFIVISFALTFQPQSNTDLQKDSFLVLDYAGNIIEKPQEVSLLIPNSKIRLKDITNAIDKARFDNKIKFILIDGDLTKYPMNYVYEIEQKLQLFKKSGKKVYAWFSNSGGSAYTLCSSANKIAMPNTNAASLNIGGYSMTVPYSKDLFDKAGITFNVIHMGDFKGSGENYTKNTISEQLETQYRLVFDDIYNSKIEMIAKNRNLDIAALDSLIATNKTRFMIPDEAINYGLVDCKMSREEFISEISAGKKLNEISLESYIPLLTDNAISSNKIAVVYVDGQIINGESAENYNGESFIGEKSFTKDIEKIKNDTNIRGVILRINSPGGSALASEIMYQKLMELKKHKPIYVSMGAYAASGGYYLSLPANKIFASPFSITGSVGVVSMFMNIEKLSGKLGVNFNTIKKYSMDDIFSFAREPNTDELELIKRSSKMIYDEFTSHVIENREIDSTIIPQVAEGRIWSGNQAVKNINFADEIGSLDNAIETMINHLKISNVKIEEYPRPADVFEKLKSLINTSVSKKSILEQLGINKFYYENMNRPLLYTPKYYEDSKH
ncbi:MAG: signal peptide peptidase SppA [Spirochaetales bacterium]|nr:signal peptide peptidase SppA [Spirochaetales bacterium]